MKALRCAAFGPIEALRVEDISPPPLGPGEVRIAVKAAGINFPDALVVQGKYQIKPPLPFTPGSEFAGVVAETDAQVTGFAIGERVFGLTSFGAFAEQVVVPAARLNRMGERLSFRQAAVLSMAYGAAMYALFDRGRLRAGETLLVLGATGGVGLAAVELASAAGLRVLAVDGDDERLARAQAKGAAELFNYRKGQLKDAAMRFTGEKGFDLILDPVGGALGEQAARCLAWKGRLLVFGFASGDIPRIATNLILLKSADLLGVFWGESQRRDDNNDRENFARLMQWHAQGRIAPHIGACFPLSHGAEAIAALYASKITGKGVIEMTG